MRKLADACIRHRRLTVLVWVVALLGTGVAAGAAGESFSTNFQLPDSDSTKALNLLEDRFPAQSGDQIQVVFADDAGLEQAATKQRIGDLVAELKGLDHVVSVTSPYEQQGAISESGTIAFATVTLDDAAFELPISSIEKIADTANEAGGDGLQVEAGGDPVRQVEQQQEGGSEVIGLLAAIVVLLITFGSLVAMAMPIVTAIVALGTALSLITLGTHVIDTADFAPALASMIGLGVGIDYALFVVTRFRQGLADGLEVREAVLEAMDTAGRAVLFAGVTVVIAMLGLFAIGVGFLHAPALAASLAVLLTMLAALTLLPAILSKVGTRIDRLRIRKPKPARAESSRWTPLEPDDPAPPLGRRDRVRRPADRARDPGALDRPRIRRCRHRSDRHQHPQGLRPARRRLRGRLQRAASDRRRRSAGHLAGGDEAGAGAARQGAGCDARRRRGRPTGRQRGRQHRHLPGLPDHLAAGQRDQRARQGSSRRRPAAGRAATRDRRPRRRHDGDLRRLRHLHLRASCRSSSAS